MAEFAMWGPEQAGERQASLDQSNLLAQGMKTLHTMGEIAQQPIDAELKQAHAKLYGAEADQKVHALEKDKAFTLALQKMSALGSPKLGGDKPGDSMIAMGMTAINAGNFEIGQKYVNTGSLMNSRAQTEAMREAQGARFWQLIDKDQRDSTASLLNTVRDQAGWDRARRQLQESETDLSQFTGDYEKDKPLIDQLAAAQMKVGEAARIALRDGESADRAATRDSVRSTQEVTRRLREVQVKLTQQRLEKLLKNSGEIDGKPAGSARKKEIDQAKTVLSDAGIKVDNQDLLEQTLANRALLRQRRNPALDFSEALNQEVIAARPELEETPGYFYGSTTKFKPKAQQPAKDSSKSMTLKPLPLDANGDLDLDKLEDGVPYQTSGGKLRWNAKTRKFRQAATSPLDLMALNGVGADPEDDDEEDT